MADCSNRDIQLGLAPIPARGGQLGLAPIPPHEAAADLSNRESS